jgi:hypothetical protein
MYEKIIGKENEPNRLDKLLKILDKLKEKKLVVKRGDYGDIAEILKLGLQTHHWSKPVLAFLDEDSKKKFQKIIREIQDFEKRNDLEKRKNDSLDTRVTQNYFDKKENPGYFDKNR